MYQIADNQLIETLDLLTVNNNNNRISIAPYGRNHVYGRNFRGAGGRSDQCSVKACCLSE